MWYASDSKRTAVDISETGDGQNFDVKAYWVGFDEGESLWEPLATIWDGAPQFVKELRKLRLDRGVRPRLQKFYGITPYVIDAYFIVKLVWSTFWW